MKFKKPSIAIACVLLAAVTASVFTACGGNAGDGGESKTPLTAPEITHNDREMTWAEVENATGYEVFENGTSIATVEEPSYTITQTTSGTEFAYTVKALCDGGEYATSSASNEIKVTILPAPQISLSGTKITWDGVEGAVSYQVYIGEMADKRYAAKSTNEYTINVETLNPGSYTFTVVAESDDNEVLSSGHSNGQVYNIPLPVTVNVPEGYPKDTVNVGVYENGSLKSSQTVTLAEGTGTAEFALEVSNYVVKAEVEEGYAAAWAYISPGNPSATIDVIELTEENTLKVGQNTVTVAGEADDDGNTSVRLVFIAQKSGIHSIVGEAGQAYTVSLNGSTVVAPSSGIEIGNFEVEQGQALVFVMTGSGTFTFQLCDYDVPHPIKLSPYYVVNDQERCPEVVANILSSSCTGVITIDEGDTYTFFFTTATLGERTVTITVNGKDYVFSGNENQQDIQLAAGETQIAIKIEGQSSDSGLNVAMFVFNGEIYQDPPIY